MIEMTHIVVEMAHFNLGIRREMSEMNHFKQGGSHNTATIHISISQKAARTQSLTQFAHERNHTRKCRA